MILEKWELPPYAMLAPMAGVSDRALRELAMRFGAVACVGEMVSCKGLVQGSRKSAELMEIGPLEMPCAIQLFGDEPEPMARAAELAQQYSPAWLDINMGCPAPKIAGNRSGSALMLEPDRAESIIRAVKEASSIPVTVKFRKGWDKPELLTPGKIEKYEMEMYFYGMVFNKGHKIRIDISSSELMEAFPNTNTGIDPYTDPKPIKATQTIYHGREYPSHVKLPVLYGL